MTATQAAVGRAADAPDGPGGLDRSGPVGGLCLAVGALVAVAAGVGVFVGGGESSTITTVHGETVPLFGRGVYRYDSLIVGSGSVGVDAVTLFLALPLLAWAALAHRRGSVRGTVTLLGVLTYCAYLYTSRAVDTAFNELFLVYVAAMSVSLFALLWTVRSLPHTTLPHVMERLPRRSTAGFLLLLPMVLVTVWLPLVVQPLVTGQPAAAVEHYTTFVTGALDLGILLPTALVGAVLVLRRLMTGYLHRALSGRVHRAARSRADRDDRRSAGGRGADERGGHRDLRRVLPRPERVRRGGAPHRLATHPGAGPSAQPTPRDRRDAKLVIAGCGVGQPPGMQ